MDEKTIYAIKQSMLFSKINDVENLLKRLNAKQIFFRKGETIIDYGEKPPIAVIIEGSASVINEDFFGNRNVISKLTKSAIFGVAYAFSGNETTARVESTENGSAIIFKTDFEDILGQDETQFLLNALKVVANGCIRYLERDNHLSRRSMREKVTSFLASESVKHNSNEFIIDYSRQELADYLAVDRSALSAELSRMKKDGLIDYKKSKFSLLKKSLRY